MKTVSTANGYPNTVIAKSLSKTWVNILLIILLSVIVFSNMFRNQFVGDDHNLVVENDFIRDWSNLPKIFTSDYFALSKIGPYYRPVTTLTFFIDYSLWDLNVFGYHFTNLLFHIVNAILIYLILSLVLKNRITALVASLLFALHPVQTEAVNGISFRVDLHAFSFFLLAIFLYIKHSSQKGPKRKFYYAGSIISFIFALFSKEMAITLPFILVLYDYCFGSREKGTEIINRSSRLQSAFGKSLKRSHIAFFLVSASYMLGRFYLFYDPSRLPEYPGGSFHLAMLITMSRVVVNYIRLLFLPVNLCADYIFPISTSILEPSVVISITVLVVILITVIKVNKHSKEISFPIFYFFVTLLPVSGIIPFGNIMAERYLYFPSLGFCILLAMIITKVINSSRLRYIRKFVVLFLIFILFAYSIRTMDRNRDWKDDLTLWSRTVEGPFISPRAFNNLGNAYLKKGLYDEAISQFEKAVQMDPTFEIGYYNLGVAYTTKDQYEEALANYQKVLQIDPGHAQTHFMVGSIYQRGRHYDLAIEEYEKAIENNLDYVEAHFNLGLLYGKKGMFIQAAESFNHAIRTKPSYIEPYIYLGLMHKAVKRYDTAIEIFKKALQISPKHSGLHNNLGLVYLEKKMYREAAQEFKRLMAIEPNFPGARRNYELALQAMKKNSFRRE